MKISSFILVLVALCGSAFSCIAEEAQKPVPAPETTQKAKDIPHEMGDRTGPVWIGIRTVLDRRSGWGWIKKEGQDWNQARWCMLEEKPGVIKAPGRYTGNPDGDQLMTYRLYGNFENFQGYEPDFDVFIPIFRLKGFEVIGPGEPVRKDPPTLSSSGPPRYAERGANLIRH